MEELKDMREQFALLQEQLEKEKIINDRLLREAVSKRVDKIYSNGWAVTLCGVFVIAVGVPCFQKGMGMSYAFCWATDLLMIFSIIATWVINLRLKRSDVRTGNLKTVAEAAVRVRQDYIRRLRIGMALIIPWLAWLGWGMLSPDNPVYGEYPIGGRITIYAILLCSGAVGGLIGYLMHKKVLRQCEDILRQVDE